MRIALAIILAALLATPALADTITVAAAVSLREALIDIAGTFKSETTHDIRFVFGSSGQLLGQVRNGAPIDVFISAAGRQVDDLLKDGLVLAPTRRVIAANTLVLIAPTQVKTPPTGFAQLSDPRHRRIAIGEPRTVPAGDYAMQVLRSLKIAEAVAPRVIHGNNVRQVLGYVERGDVSAGIVYFTDALQSGDKVQIVERADERWHEPISYPAIIVKDTNHRAVAQQFLDYLRTAPARKALEDRGFTLPQLERRRPRDRKP